MAPTHMRQQTMPCQTVAKPSRANRLKLIVGLEESYGSQPNDMLEIPIYDTTPYQNETDVKNVIEENLSYNVPVKSYSTLPIKTFFAGTGSGEILPGSLMPMQGCGFNAQILPGAVALTPSVYNKSLYGQLIYDNEVVDIPGLRGGFNIGAEYGQPIEFNYSFGGKTSIYREAASAYESPEIDEYVLLKDINLSIGMPDGTTYIPVVKNVKINLDRNLAYLGSKDPKTIDISRVEPAKQFSATWNMLIERDPSIDFRDCFVGRRLFKTLDMTLGSSNGNRLQIKNGTNTKIRLDNNPINSDTNNVRVINLQFSLTGTNFLNFLYS